MTPYIDDKLSSSRSKIQESLCQKSETIYYASEVTKLHEHGGKQTRILVITDGGVYVMVKPSKRKTVSIITNLERVVYTEQENTLFFKFNDNQKTFTFKSQHALRIGKTLLGIHRAITMKVDKWKRQVRVESNPEGKLEYPESTMTRVQGSLRMRILALANEVNETIDNQTLSRIAQWDSKPVPDFRLVSDDKVKSDAAAGVIAKSLAYDSELRRLTLVGFCPQFLPSVLGNLTMNSQFLLALGLDGYKESVKGTLRLSACERTRMEELSFRDCASDFIFDVMGGLKEFEGVIKIMTIVKCKLAKDKWAGFFNILAKTTCFVSLRRINFEEDTTDELDMESFCGFLGASKIVALSIGKASCDAGQLLESIGQTKGMLRQLYLRNGRLFKPVPASLQLSESILYLNLEHTQYEPEALTALFNAILTKPRSRLLTVHMKGMASARQGDIVKCFDIENIQSVLAELVFADNPLNPGNMPAFIDFLKTQKYLMHLDLSGCFKKDVDKCLSILADYVIESKLQGLELNSDKDPLGPSLVKFLGSITGKCHLQTLSVRGSASGDEGLQALLKFVQSSPKMSSLSCDGCGPKSAEVFVAAYNEFQKLDMLDRPRIDEDAMKGKGASLPPDIACKNPPKTWLKRLGEYENFDVNSSAILQPMDALMSVMSLMVNAIKNPDCENNIFEQQNVTSMIRDSLKTSNVNFGTKVRGTDPIMEMVGSNSRTAEEIMTEYQTMHDF